MIVAGSITNAIKYCWWWWWWWWSRRYRTAESRCHLREGLSWDSLCSWGPLWLDHWGMLRYVFAYAVYVYCSWVYLYWYFRMHLHTARQNMNVGMYFSYSKECGAWTLGPETHGEVSSARFQLIKQAFLASVTDEEMIRETSAPYSLGPLDSLEGPRLKDPRTPQGPFSVRWFHAASWRGALPLRSRVGQRALVQSAAGVEFGGESSRTGLSWDKWCRSGLSGQGRQVQIFRYVRVGFVAILFAEIYSECAGGWTLRLALLKSQ